MDRIMPSTAPSAKRETHGLTQKAPMEKIEIKPIQQ